MNISPERFNELIAMIKAGDRLAFYSSKEWKKTRQIVRERDRNECQHCKANGLVYNDQSEPGKRKRLDVDHIKELEEYPELCLELDNLITLCIRCHNAKHNRYVARKNKWADDEKW